MKQQASESMLMCPELRAFLDAGGPRSGRLAELARLLDVPPGNINRWARHGVPLAHAANLERVTGGAVRRWHMYPGSWWHLFPELVGAPGAPGAPVKAGSHATDMAAFALAYAVRAVTAAGRARIAGAVGAAAALQAPGLASTA